MEMNSKILNPINIRLGKNNDFVVNNGMKKVYCSLIPGAIIGGEHFGFIVSYENNNIHDEKVYLTENRITALGIENNYLQVFEDEKKDSWVFGLDGELIRKASNNKNNCENKEYIKKK